MADAPKLEKAELRELDSGFENEINRSRWTAVQFNPESLKVSFANQLQQPAGAGDQRGTPARQFVGAGTTKLALTLWFDATAPKKPPDQGVDDVRRLTQKVAYFITPQSPPGSAQNQLVPPAVRFVWGSFQFDGMMDSLEENLEFFSSDGRPLRASMSLSLSQQKITEFTFRPTAGPAAAGGAPPGVPSPGTQPLTQAPAGSTFQGLADAQGQGANWQAAAAANGIENPRRLAPGLLVDLNVSVGIGR